MKKLHEYLQHAAECRDMARTAQPAHRQQLEQMAETRKRQLERRAGGRSNKHGTVRL